MLKFELPYLRGGAGGRPLEEAATCAPSTFSALASWNSWANSACTQYL